MSDLISRQNAIDVCLNGKCANIYDCADAIKQLPSAEHHKLNIAEYIHDQYPDVWKQAEKELEVPSAERGVNADNLIKKIKQLEPLNNQDCPQWVINIIKGEING